MSGADKATARLAGGDGHRPPTHSAYAAYRAYVAYVENGMAMRLRRKRKNGLLQSVTRKRGYSHDPKSPRVPILRNYRCPPMKSERTGAPTTSA